MKSKFLAQTIFSLILVAFLTITSVIISPQVAVAKSSSNTPLESLTSGVELQEQGDLDKAAVSYQEAINSVVANKEIDMYIAAKQRLAKIKRSQGDIKGANKLREEAEYTISGLQTAKLVPCGEPCPPYIDPCSEPPCEKSGSGPLIRCRRCR